MAANYVFTCFPINVHWSFTGGGGASQDSDVSVGYI